MIAEVFGWSPEAWTAIGTLALAIATVVAVFLQEPVRKRRFGMARVALEVSASPPDVHMIEMRNPTNGVLIGRVLYLRLRATHRGGPSIENAEVVATGVWRIVDGHREPHTAFLPMPLLWSSASGSTTIRIPAGVFRHCDLGYIGRIGVSQSNLTLSTAVQPFGVGSHGKPASVLEHGAWEIETVLTADNVKPVHSSWHVGFSADWSDDESVMLSKVTVQRLR